MSYYCYSSIGSATSKSDSDFNRWGRSRSRGRGWAPRATPPPTLTTAYSRAQFSDTQQEKPFQCAARDFALNTSQH